MAAPRRLWHFPPMTQELDQDLTLAAEFPAVSEAEWHKLVEAALKGASFEKRLVSETYDGLRVEPLYARAVGASAVAGRAAVPWRVMARVDHPDPAEASKQALVDLENGATGLTLVMAGSISANGYGLEASAATLDRALKDVVLDAGIAIDLNLSPPTRHAARLFADLVTSRSIPPAKVNWCASVNPIGGFAVSGEGPGPWSDVSKKFAAMIGDLAGRGFRGPFAVADGRVIHNAGGSEAQELAFAIASGVDYLRALEAAGVPLDAARGMIYFRLSADDDEFLTIAKFRALRKLWAQVEAACGLAPKPAMVAAETAWRMMTQRDPYVNMLRTTSAGPAAGRGGADSITVLPFTQALGLPDAFARRVARNMQLVLLEESNLYRVADPAAGSGAIETLTTQIAQAAWTLFQEIDAAGGVWNALERKLVQEKVAAVRAEREKAVARREDALTGASDYPNLQEAPVKVLDVAPVTTPKEGDAAVTTEPLPRIRLAAPYEALRDASDRFLAKTGTRPKVFLANLGRMADFTARATFAKNFYEAGGIEAVTNDGFKDQAEMIAAFKASGAKLACLCSSDKVYEAQAADAAKALTAAGATVHLAGRPGENEENWRQAGAKDFIYVGCDVLAALRAIYATLKIED
jgi:methylmalonyl-CoA mutase